MTAAGPTSQQELAARALDALEVVIEASQSVLPIPVKLKSAETPIRPSGEELVRHRVTGIPRRCFP